MSLVLDNLALLAYHKSIHTEWLFLSKGACFLMTISVTFSVIPFSVRLAVIRAARLLSQADVSEMTGIDQSLISRYERGLAPTERHVEAIEKALNVDFDAPEMERAFKVLSQPQLPTPAPVAEAEPVKETI
jgi:hypothetical protein